MHKIILTLSILLSTMWASAQPDTTVYHERWRPQVHFSPKAHWTNDPNGMVYSNGTYHLFFQYFPGGTTWGPMHWGHTISKDLIHWQEQPVALYPDSLGYIFSGSAVADLHNTSGFGKGGKTPLVAIYTNHDPKGEHDGKNDFQNQSIAYSLDEGKTWTKYSGNPVLKNPGIRDFRDPKVNWNETVKKWIMTLATQDHITFFSSPDLKSWTKESEFGKTLGAHGGVWECPDLLAFDHQGKKVWVLIVNINPGGPNKGSATQYFTGDFDGHTFTPDDSLTKWIDYGADEYAGITWSNTGKRHVFLGWMSNWMYANEVPTKTWRNAMTIPRELALVKENRHFYVSSLPVKELQASARTVSRRTNFKANGDVYMCTGPLYLTMKADELKDFAMSFHYGAGAELVIGFDKASNTWFIDRTTTGEHGFNKEFAARHTAPRIATGKELELTLVVDETSVEMFADHGVITMTDIFFPNAPLQKISITAVKELLIRQWQLSQLKSIWK